jgi:ketosteroid isomerase-like protein
VISRYFERDADRDIDSIVSLFAEDATVIDEGEERHGTAEIRAWQTGAASNTPTRPRSPVPKRSPLTATSSRAA